MKTAVSTTQPITVREATRDRASALRLTVRQRRAVVETQQIWHRLALHLLQKEELPRPMALGITSATRGEGKTTSSIGLAAALARETGEPVLLVDADLRRSGIAKTCQLAPAPGLIDYLLERATLDNTQRPTPLGNLTVVVAGDGTGAGTELSVANLTTALRRRLPGLLAAWKEKYTHIVLDLPAVLGNVNTEQMVRELDGAMLAVRSGVTPLAKAGEAARLLEGVHLIGAIHIGQPSTLPRWIDQLLSE